MPTLENELCKLVRFVELGVPSATMVDQPALPVVLLERSAYIEKRITPRKYDRTFSFDRI